MFTGEKPYYWQCDICKKPLDTKAGVVSPSGGGDYHSDCYNNVDKSKESSAQDKSTQECRAHQ
jgi:hypothetical protein